MGHQVRGVQSPQHRQTQTVFRVQGSSFSQLLLGSSASFSGLKIPPSLPLQGRSAPITTPYGPDTHSVSLLSRQPWEAVESSVTLRRRGAAQVRCQPLSHQVLSGAGLYPQETDELGSFGWASERGPGLLPSLQVPQASLGLHQHPLGPGGAGEVSEQAGAQPSTPCTLSPSPTPSHPTPVTHPSPRLARRAHEALRSPGALGGRDRGRVSGHRLAGGSTELGTRSGEAAT